VAGWLIREVNGISSSSSYLTKEKKKRKENEKKKRKERKRSSEIVSARSATQESYVTTVRELSL
jgi:hypothetical protein